MVIYPLRRNIFGDVSFIISEAFMHLSSILNSLRFKNSASYGKDEESLRSRDIDVTSIRDAVWGGDDLDYQDPQGFYYPCSGSRSEE